jgi:predicted transcriptional regulator
MVRGALGVTKEVDMSQTLLEMAKDLVLAQINTKHLTPDSIQGALHSTYETLQRLDASASPGENGHGHGPSQGLGGSAEVNWKSSITRHAIRCLECGETFKQLSLRHLSAHDLDPRSYRVKYNIPRTQSLSAREVTARRRELAQQIRPWELAPSKPEAVKTKKASKTQSKPVNTKAPRAQAKKRAARS